MGVYVKGMKFPDSCCVCPIMNQDDGYCEVNHDRADDIWNRPDWCPLVEVHTPHGRLCDADAVRECLEEGDDCKDKEWALMLLDWAVSKRTVIEAEE